MKENGIIYTENTQTAPGFKIGCHLSTEGGYEAMGKRILSIGGNTFQFFTKNPRGKTSTKAPDPEDVQALCRLIEENNMIPPLAHAPYTYNPCSADEGVRQYSGDSMKRELEFLESIPGALYNFHPGCHVGQGAEAGMQMVADMLNRILWKGMKTKVLIETMAGKGTELGRDFEEMRRMLDLIQPDLREYVGVCLDTCHIQDGGYNLEKDTDGVIAEFDRVVGLENIHAIHLNDSKNPCGTRKDRHDKIGEGYIGPDAIRQIINHPKLRHLPFYLETPNEIDGYAKEIALLRSWREE